MPSITFSDVDFKGIDADQDDPMVIIVEVVNFVIMSTLIDQVSLVDILYWKTFKRLGLAEEAIVPMAE